MKYLLTAMLAFGLLACQSNTQDNVQLKTDIDSLSYTIGMDIGKNLKDQNIEVEASVLAKGIKDVLENNSTLLTAEEAQKVISAFQQRMMTMHEQKMSEQGEKNKKEGEEFLAKNKEKAGVITLPSGLQYKVITMGTGKKPKSSDNVTVHYRGTLLDGTEFDSSIGRGEPVTFPLHGVIKGWTEGLQLMPVGSKWEFFIPSDLAYGERSMGQNIPPNATLIFEVELIAIAE